MKAAGLDNLSPSDAKLAVAVDSLFDESNDTRRILNFYLPPL